MFIKRGEPYNFFIFYQNWMHFSSSASPLEDKCNDSPTMANSNTLSQGVWRWWKNSTFPQERLGWVKCHSQQGPQASFGGGWASSRNLVECWSYSLFSLGERSYTGDGDDGKIAEIARNYEMPAVAPMVVVKISVPLFIQRLLGSLQYKSKRRRRWWRRNEINTSSV